MYLIQTCSPPSCSNSHGLSKGRPCLFMRYLWSCLGKVFSLIHMCSFSSHFCYILIHIPGQNQPCGSSFPNDNAQHIKAKNYLESSKKSFLYIGAVSETELLNSMGHRLFPLMQPTENLRSLTSSPKT